MNQMKLIRCLLLLFVFFNAAPAFAVQPDEMLADPALEARARALSQELRCLVCQNESIDDSAAPLAHDLRVLLRERLKKGDSDQQVLDFLVARYGEFVLLKPPFAWHTALLWLAPGFLLILGVGGLLLAARRRARPSAAAKPLSAEESARLAQVVAQTDAGASE
jgi:cytochrome c-type biogenesis protein CcmH